jgi:hypothetical protein
MKKPKRSSAILGYEAVEGKRGHPHFFLVRTGKEYILFDKRPPLYYIQKLHLYALI